MKRVVAFATRAASSALGPRSSVLDRVRFLFLLFFVFNAAVSAFLGLRGPRQDLTQLIASYSLTYLVLYAARGYWKGRFPLFMDVIAAVALFGSGLEVNNALRLYLLFYGVLLYRSLYGTAWGVTAITSLFLTALLTSVAFASQGNPQQPLIVAQVLVNVPGFAAGAWLMHQVKVTLMDYIEALRRERVLTRSADELVAAENREHVYRAGIEGAVGLVGATSRARAAISIGSARTQRQVAVGPPARLVKVPEVKTSALPQALQTALGGLRPVRLRVENAPLLAAGEEDTEPQFSGWIVASPLTIEGKLRGFIVAAGEELLPKGVEDGLARLGSSVALALERVNLAEDLRVSTESLKSSEARFRSLVQNSSDVITLLDEEARITYVTPAVEKLLGYQTGTLLNTPLFQVLHPEDLKGANSTFQGLLRTDFGEGLLGTRWRHTDGSYRYMETILSNQLADPNVRAVVLNTRDVTERKDLEDKLRHQAHHDPLTALSNRTLFKDRVAAGLARHRGTRGSLAVLFLDLDDFKHVNDSLGHAAGDSLLRAVALRLQDCLGPADTVARFGGDEFAILLESIPDDSYPIKVAERIMGAFRLPLRTGGVEMNAAFSIGIAISTPDSSDPEELLRNADVAMYRAKGRGKRTFEVFELSMHAAALERLEMEYDLRQAIEKGQLIVRYQPIVELDSEEIYGVEALVRWDHPVKGLVQPDRFIPLAEETGLIAAMGEWVLEQACRDVKSWETQFPDRRPLRLGVNISVRQLQREKIVDEIRHVLKRTGMAPDRMTLEITESAVIREGEETSHMLQKLRTAGIKVAIDDFGTGYSSLSYLARFPIDVIKIDKAFVRASGGGPKNLALLKAIIGLGHSLGVEIVAEGVETQQQSRILEPLGCRGQGYYFSKPVTSEEMQEMLSRPSGIRAARRPRARRRPRDSARPQLELLDGTGNRGPQG